MPPKQNNRLAEIRARVARRSDAADDAHHTDEPATTTTPAVDTPEPVSDVALAAASAHFLGAAEQITQGRAVTALPLRAIAPDERPTMRQPRLLPHPDVLMIDGAPAPAYQGLVVELLTLGASLRERQIQPIIVYPGTSDVHPEARYLILVGHRRWTAAILTDLETIDAVIVEPPDEATRVRVQYAENEAREEFSDMERAWTLVQMKRALSDAPWETVETQFGISRTRRHELARMLAFTEAQQQQVALLRLQETQARPLHTGIRNGDLSTTQVDTVLHRLSQIAVARADAATQGDADGVTQRRSGIDGPTVARLVARTLRATPLSREVPTPRWFSPLREQVMRATLGLRRAAARIDGLSAEDTAVLFAELTALVEGATALTQAMQGSIVADLSNTAPAHAEPVSPEQEFNDS
jgi:ParB/RepB/Spo0J family partition protein